MDFSGFHSLAESAGESMIAGLADQRIFVIAITRAISQRDTLRHESSELDRLRLEDAATRRRADDAPPSRSLATLPEIFPIIFSDISGF